MLEHSQRAQFGFGTGALRVSDQFPSVFCRIAVCAQVHPAWSGRNQALHKRTDSISG